MWRLKYDLPVRFGRDEDRPDGTGKVETLGKGRAGGSDLGQKQVLEDRRDGKAADQDHEKGNRADHIFGEGRTGTCQSGFQIVDHIEVP